MTALASRSSTCYNANQHGRRDQETKMKAIEVKTNSKGIRYALVTDGATFLVYVERENYCRPARETAA